MTPSNSSERTQSDDTRRYLYRLESCCWSSFSLSGLIAFWIFSTSLLAAFVDEIAVVVWAFAFLIAIPFAHIAILRGLYPRNMPRSDHIEAETDRFSRTPSDSLVLRRSKRADRMMMCGICLQDVQVGEMLAGSENNACIDEFHLECILRALESKSPCPFCGMEFWDIDEEKSDLSMMQPPEKARDATSVELLSNEP